MMEDAKPTRQRGDLANRIVRRRQELGLTHEQLAKLAHVDVGYLEYLEQRGGDANADLLMRPANALQTTPMNLAGGDVGRAPGPGRPGPTLRLRRLPMSSVLGIFFPAASGALSLLPSEVHRVPVNFRFVGVKSCSGPEPQP